MQNERDKESGWFVEDDKVIVVEKLDSFNRRAFDWQNVPSTLLDESTSVGGQTVLYRPALEEFLGRNFKRGQNGLFDTLSEFAHVLRGRN